jgi:uncharacterized repeat protein (TIGR04052 family)
MSRRTVVLGALVALACSACAAEDEVRNVTVQFAGLVDDQPASCGQAYSGLGMTGTSYTLSDYRLYVSDVRLVTAGGGEVPLALEQDGVWQLDDIALLDFETGGTGGPAGNAEVNTTLRGTVAEAGPYTGIRFVVGVPFERNHGDTSAAPAPLNVTAMFWNWQGGYKFIRIDGSTTGLSGGFFLHLGSTGCDGDRLTGGTTSCANPNRMEVALDGFDPTARTIDIDVADVFAESDLDVNAAAQPGCMSNPMDPECGPIFSRLGLSMSGGTPGAQRLFSAGK